MHVPLSARRRVVVGVATLALVVYLTTAGGSMTTSDAVSIFELSEKIVDEGSVALPRPPGGFPVQPGVDGRFYSPWGIGQSLYNIPFLLAGRAAGRMFGPELPDGALAKAFVALGSAVAAAAAVAVFFVFAWELSESVRGALFGAAALGLGTLLWPYAGFGFNGPLATACLVVAVYSAWSGVRRRRPHNLTWAGLWLGAAWLTRHELVLAAVPLAAWIAWELRQEHRAPAPATGLAFFAPGLLGAGTFSALYNAYRFGSPFFAGHSEPFNGAGFYGFLLSPQGSLFLYSPLVVMGLVGLYGLSRRDRSTALLLAAALGVLFLFYASLANWQGGRSYGSRYLLPILPLLCLPLATLWRDAGPRLRRLLVAGLVASSLVQLPAVLVDYSRLDVEPIEAGGGRVERVLDAIGSSPLGRTARAGAHAVPTNLGYLLGLAEPPRVRPAEFEDEASGGLDKQLAFSLDFWWLYLLYLGILPRGLAIAVPCAAAVFTVVAATALWRRAPALPSG